MGKVEYKVIKQERIVYYFMQGVSLVHYYPWWVFTKGYMDEDGWSYPNLRCRIPLYLLRLFLDIHFVWYGPRFHWRWFHLGITKVKLIRKREIHTLCQ